LLGADWRKQAADASNAFERNEEVPPEARGDADSCGELAAETDCWLIARLLVGLFLPVGSLASAEGGKTIIAASPQALSDKLQANLWLLFHWLLAPRPSDRPAANEVAALMSTAAWAEPKDLLDGMPTSVRQHCSRAAVAAARQLAVDETVAALCSTGADVARLAELSLEELRNGLADCRDVDRLCENCGIDPSAGAFDGEVGPQEANAADEGGDDARCLSVDCTGRGAAVVPCLPEASTNGPHSDGAPGAALDWAFDFLAANPPTQPEVAQPKDLLDFMA